MKSKKYLSILGVGLLSASLLAGCSLGITYDKNLVGTGDVYDSVESLTRLEDKKADQVITAINKKYKKVEVKSLTADIDVLCDMDFSSEDSGNVKMNLKIDLSDELQYDATQDIIYQQMDGSISILGMEVPLQSELYTIKEDRDEVTYSKTSVNGEDSNWEKNIVKPEGESKEKKDSNNIQFDSEAIKSIYMDKETKSYVFEVDSSNFSQVEEMLSSTLEQQNELTGLNSSLENLTIYISADKGLGLTGFYVDLSSVFDISDSTVKTTVKDFYISGKFKTMNEDLKIEIPKEAKNSNIEGPDLSASVDDVLPIPTDIEQTEPMVLAESRPESALSLSDITVKVNGNTLSLPGPASILKLDAIRSQDTAIEPGAQGTMELKSSNEDEYITILVRNDSDTAKDAIDCTAIAIYADTYGNTSSIASINGITYGATVEQVMDVFGGTTSVYTSDLFSSYSYDMDDFTMSFDFNEDGYLDSFSFYAYEY